MALGNGHQGIADTAYGTYRFNKAESKPELVDVVRYPAECVNPPAGTTRSSGSRRDEGRQVQLAGFQGDLAAGRRRTRRLALPCAPAARRV